MRHKEIHRTQRTGWLRAAVLGANTGNATVTPNPLQLANGQSGFVVLTWSGLETGSYIGRVTFGDSGTETFVSVIVTPAGNAVAPDNDKNKKDKPAKPGKPKLKPQQLQLPDDSMHTDIKD